MNVGNVDNCDHLVLPTVQSINIIILLKKIIIYMVRIRAPGHGSVSHCTRQALYKYRKTRTVLSQRDLYTLFLYHCQPS